MGTAGTLANLRQYLIVLAYVNKKLVGWKSAVVAGLAISGMFAMSPMPYKTFVFLETLEKSSRLGYGSLLEQVVYSIDVAANSAT